MLWTLRSRVVKLKWKNIYGDEHQHQTEVVCLFQLTWLQHDSGASLVLRYHLWVAANVLNEASFQCLYPRYSNISFISKRVSSVLPTTLH